MYPHPIFMELLARDQIERNLALAQRERVATREPLLSHFGALRQRLSLRSHARRPARGAGTTARRTSHG